MERRSPRFEIIIRLEKCRELTATLLGCVAHIEDLVDVALMETGKLDLEIQEVIDSYGDGGGEVEATDPFPHGDTPDVS